MVRSSLRLLAQTASAPNPEIFSRQNHKAVDYRKIGPVFRAIGTAFYYGAKTHEEKGKPLLVSIAASHYCEKARWALDLSPLANQYKEDTHFPGLSVFQTNFLTNYKKSNVPLLKIPQKNKENESLVFDDSTEILRYLHKTYPEECGFLYPPEHETEILELESYFGDTLGATTRQYAYTHLLDNAVAKRNPKLQKEYTTWIDSWVGSEASAFEKNLYGLVGSTVMKWIIIRQRLKWEHRQLFKERIDEVYDLVNKRLSGGQKYLVGNQLTAADISFASLVNPILLAPQLEGVLPMHSAPSSLNPVLEEYRQDVQRWNETPAGQHALRLYREERYPNLKSGDFLMKIGINN